MSTTDLPSSASDGYHTFDELYMYRMLYNAHAARGWLAAGIPVVKSWRHHDGKECFGGGWFIVTADLPEGQVSNHYKAEHWELFAVPEMQTAPEWDGHTPAEAADRLRQSLVRIAETRSTALNRLRQPAYLADGCTDPLGHSWITYRGGEPSEVEQCAGCHRLQWPDAHLEGTTEVNASGWGIGQDNGETALIHNCTDLDDGEIVAWYDGGKLAEILAEIRREIAAHECGGQS